MHDFAALFRVSWLQSGACVGEITGQGLLGKIHKWRTLGLCDNPAGEFNPTFFILIRWEMELMLRTMESSKYWAVLKMIYLKFSLKTLFKLHCLCTINHISEADTNIDT